jgi:hypothetical protein
MPTINIPVGAAVTSGLGVSLLRRPSPGVGAAVTVGYAPSLIQSTITYTARPGKSDFTIANVAAAGDLTLGFIRRLMSPV